MQLNLRQMEVFRAVWMCRSISGAARTLNISQPAISRMLAHMEQGIGFALFTRHTRETIPTAEAEFLFPGIEEVFQKVAAVNLTTTDLIASLRGSLRLTVSPSIAMTFVTAVVREFKARYPEADVQYKASFIADIPSQLISRQSDLAISVLPIDHPALESETIRQREMVCLIPEGHELAQFERPEYAQILQHSLVLYDRTTPFGLCLMAHFKKLGLTPHIAIEVPRSELGLAMVAQGAGVSLVDEDTLPDPLPPGVLLRRTADPLVLDMVLLRRAAAGRSERMGKIFVTLLRERAAAQKETSR